MTDKLRECPFCGGESWITKRKSDYDGTILYGGRCINTGCCEIPSIYTKAAAIDKWNTRKPMDRIVEQLKCERKSILGKYDHNTPVLDTAVCKIAFNDGIDTAIDIVKGVQDE